MGTAPIVIDTISKPFKWIANSKPMQAVCKKFEIDEEKALRYTTIASIVGKDGIGCYMYVNQSLHNEKIPEEKRGFVAALDLTNGGLMILSQLLMFFTLSKPKVQEKLFGKFFNKVFSEKAFNEYKKHLRGKNEFTSKSKEEIRQAFNSIRKTSETTFAFLTSLVASTILAKRVVVPFIATPMATWAKEKFLDKKKPAQNQPQDVIEVSNSSTSGTEKEENKTVPVVSPEILEQMKELPNSNILKHLIQK